MNPRCRCLLAPAVWLLAACSLETGDEQPVQPVVRAGEFGEAACFLRHTAMDFEVLDDRNLIVFAPGRADPYHVQVSPAAAELRYATVLAFESTGSRICGYPGEELRVARSGGVTRRLLVLGVYRLDAAALAGLQARFGRPMAGQKPVPQPGAGAQIERKLGEDPSADRDNH